MFNWQYPVYRFFNRCRNSIYVTTLLTSLFLLSSPDVFATGCDNITHPGSIGSDQSVCPGVAPATIQSLASPSGGTGTIEYIWLETTVYPPSVSNSTIIVGANGPSYSPGAVSQTTYYRRCARRSGCSTYVGETNWVTISINPCCSPLTVSASVTDALCSGGIVSTSCPCSGKMTNLSVRFNGSNGSTVKVYNKSDMSVLINTYNNVSTGDILFVDASGLSNGEFESSTYFEVVGTSGLTSIHTSCSQQIDGLTFGDFTVVGYTDGSGNVCNSLVCSGSIDITVTSGTPPYLYCWSNGSNSEDINGICPGTYSLTVSDQNGCSSVHSFTVGEQPSPISITGNVTDASCMGIINPMNCPCSGKMTNLSLMFDGANGSTVKAYTKSDKSVLINTYTNVDNGDIIFVDASGLSNGEFESSTYFEVVGTSGLTSIHTSCSQQIDGMSFGDFTVVGYTDGSGNVCNVLSCSGSIDITVSGATDSTSSKSTVMVSKRVSDYKDDAEEYKKDGSMLVNGDHLDLGYQSTHDQIVGMRFRDLNLPQGAVITNAYIEFVAKFSKSITTNLVFNGEDTDDASAFSTSTNDISNRTLTSSSVNWNNVPAWTQGVTYVSPDLSAIVQEIVNRTGWSSGNDLAIIVDGTGQRPAVSEDFDNTKAPLLVIEYSITTPAVSTISYQWSNGATTEDLSNVCAGTYTVTVTDALGCIAEQTYVVTEQPSTLSLSATKVDADCGGVINSPSNCPCNGKMTSLTVKYLGTSGVDIEVCEDNNCNDIITTFNNVQNGDFLTVSASGLSNGEFGSSTYFRAVGSTTSTSIHTSCSQAIGGMTFGDYTVAGYTDGSGNVCNSIICNGSIDLSASGGNTPYSYSWSNGSTTEDLSNVCPGTYSVTVTDAGGCSEVLSITVDEAPPSLVANVNSINANCGPIVYDPIETCACDGKMTELVILYNGSSSTVDVKDGGGSTILTYSNVSNGDTLVVSASAAGLTEFDSKTFFNDGGGDVEIHTSCSQDIQGGTFGNFKVIGYTDGAGNVCNEDQPPCDCNGEMTEVTLLFNGTNGSTVEVYKNTGDPALLTLSNVDNNQIIVITPSSLGLSGFGSKIYVGSNGGTALEVHTSCSQDISGLVVGDLTVVGYIDGSGTECSGVECAGSASSSPSGGTPPYSFQWSTGDMTSSVSGLCPGVYFLTVTDSIGCSIVQCVEIGESPDYVISVSSTNPSCAVGACDGSITLSVTGGLPPLTYTWNGPGLTNANLGNADSNLCSGTYSIVISDANGCSDSVTVTLTNPPPIVLIPNSTDVNCAGNSDGTATVSASGGTGSYSYQWSNGATTQSIVGLSGGTYSVTVTDANGCTAVTSTLVEEPLPLTAAASAVDAQCFATCDGSATVTVNGGNGGLTYLWNDPNSQTTYTATGLCAGVYTVTVTDDHGCTTTASAIVHEPTQIVISINTTNTTCSDSGATGSAIANASGGTPGYSWQWDSNAGNQTTKTATGLAAGNYLVTVTDANGCIEIASAKILEDDPLDINISSTPNSCFGGSDGTASVNAKNGQAPFSYIWSNGGMSSTISGISAGSYSVTVTDDNGCTATASVTVEEPDTLIAQATCIPVSCFGANDGIASSIVTGGTPPYVLTWYSTIMHVDTIPPDTFPMANNLKPQMFYGFVVDANGCTDSLECEITEPDSLTTATSSTDVSCSGLCDGTATANASGGTPPYSYLWSDGSTSANNSGLCAGIYSITVTDANGCTSTANVIIQEPLPISLSTSHTNVSCNGFCDGTASVSASGGTPPYSYSWSNGDISASLSGLCAGPYTVTVTDANGCTATETIFILEPDPLLTIPSQTNVSCNGFCDGSATITAIGGIPPYSYAWSIGATTASITGLCPGNYSVTVTDANGCTSTQSVWITEPDSLDLATSSTDVSCHGECDGTSSVTVSGGTSPYSYIWSNGTTTPNATGLCAGNYTVTVTDANGCTSTAFVTIDEPTEINLITNTTNAGCVGNNTGTASVSASGGVPGYTYSWSNGGNTQTITGLAPGVYTVTVTDANGCTAIDTAIVQEQTNTLTLNAIATDADCGGISIDPSQCPCSGGMTDLTVKYIGASGVDINVCEDMSCNDIITSFTNVQNGQFLYVDASGLSGGDFGSKTYFSVVGSGNSTEIHTSCSQDIGGLTFGDYTVAGFTDGSGNVCNAIICNGSIDLMVSGGTAPFTYSWSNGQSTEDISTLCAGVYNVTVMDDAGCTATLSVTVEELPPTIDANITTTNADCGPLVFDPIETCACNGKMTELVILYNGSSSTVDVKDGGGTTILTFNNVNNGDTLVVSASAAGLSEFDSKTFFNDGGGDIEIHTSCSQDIQGGTFGNFKVIGYTDGSGNVCDEDRPPCDCNGEMTEVSLLFTGSSGSSVEFYDKLGDPVLLTLSNVSNGQLIVVTPSSLGLSGFGSKIFVGSNGGTALEVHTSCSQDISGLVVGDLTVVGYVDGSGNECNSVECEGTASAAPSGGTPPYTYQWSTGETSSSISGLCPGSYCVTITDSLGCSITQCFDINQDCGSIGDYVWCDDNGDGIQDSNEAPIAGVIIQLLDASGNVIATDTTDANGFYLFDSLSAGTYTVNVVDSSVPDGKVLTTNNDPTTVNLGQGENRLDVDFGYKKVGSIGDYVWCDTNGDGIQDPNEPPIAGVVIQLLDSSGNVIATDTTDANGNYLFDNLPAGLYTVNVIDSTVPDGKTLTTNNDPTTVNLGAGENRLDVDFGYQYFGSIGDYVWCDDNGDGIQDPNEAPIAGVVIQLFDGSGNLLATDTTDANGNYLFPNLPPGTYYVDVVDSTVPDGKALTTNNDPTTVNLAPGETRDDVDFGYRYTGSIGDYVWCDTNGDGIQDPNEPPIAGVIIQLLDSAGNILATDTTDANGNYLFDNLPPGVYTVNVIDSSVPAGKDLTTNNDPTTVNLGPGENRLDVDFGYQYTGSIGDYVWLDLNNDGIQDPNEPPIAGVTIQLLDSAGNVLGTMVTDSAGYYDFLNLPPGLYTVNVVDSTVPPGLVSTTLNDPMNVNLGPGEDYNDADFGYNCVNPILTAISTNVSCNGGNDGSIDLTVNNGSGPSYTYLWSTGETTEDISGLVAGTYSVTVVGTSLGDCSDTLVIPIFEPTPLVVLANSTKENCAGANDGTATASAFGGTPPYTYAWSNGGNSATITGLAPGLYSVVVTDANLCTATDTTEVLAAIAIDLAVNTTDVTCFGGSDGQALVNALGGKGPYTYMWDANTGNQTTKTATGLAPGNYEVTVTDANGCVDSIIAKILEPAKIVLSTTTDTVFCTDDASGMVTVSIDSGGVAPFSYMWDSAAGSQTTATATGLTAGSYSVTVTDDNGCTASATANVVLANGLVVDVTCQPVSCNGDTDGSASSTVSGGAMPYTYLWSNGGTGPSISGLAAGTYTLTLTDANGCVVVRSCTVTEPDPLVVTATCTPVTCFGSKDGTASSNITGGTQPYIFTWFSSVMHIDTIPPDSLPSATGLGPGLFTGYVVDANGCTDTLVPCEITEPAPLVGQATSTDVSCHGGSDGTASVVVSGGNGGYQYQWNTGATTQSISGLSAGVYTVTTTDSKNCICIDSVVVGQPDSLVLTSNCTPVTCFGSKDGSVTSMISGGTAPYILTYTSTQTHIDTIPPSPFPSASGRGPGSFSGFVVDANGCVDSTACMITEPAPLVGMVSSTNVSCFGDSDGTATVSANGGNGGYTYNWSTGATTPTISGLSAGVYTVTTTDSKGCICVDSAVITQPDSLNAIATCTPVSCFGSKDGTASANVSGGTAPYIITYFSSVMHVDTIPPSPLPSGSNLGPGFFYGYVVDANGCIDSLSCTITEPAPLVGTVSSTPVSCNGGMDGSASASATGGNGSYSFNWSNGDTTATISGLAAGTYSVTISDPKGCICVDSVTVSQPPALQISLTVGDVSCFGGDDGSVSATVTGGTPPTAYLWSTGATTSSISGLTAGTYGLTVTDDNGCTTAMSATVNQPDSLIALANCVPVSCFGAHDGSASAIITGGTQPYIFTWFSTIMHIDTIPPDTFPMETGLGPQSFYGYVVDANGCTDSLACEITEPDEIILTTSTISVSCFGGNDGSATVNVVNGGVGSLSYQWDVNAGNQTTPTATGLSAGTYSVTVTDATGCSATASATVTQPTLLTMSISSTPVSCNGGSDGTATAVFGGGTPPYSCVWSSGDTTITSTGLSAGTYTVVCTDANGCTVSGTVTISEPAALTTTTTSTMPNCNGGNDGSATVNPSGGTPAYSYLWDANAGNQITMTATGLSAGTYGVTVTDANGCTTSDNVTVNQPPPLTGGITRTPVTCNGGSDGTATVTIGGGTAPYTCVWSTGDTTNMISGLSAGTYSVTCTDANGCSLSTSINILEPTAIQLTETHTNVSCNGGNDGSGTVMASGGTPGYSYAWPSGGMAATETGLSAGSYTVTVTDNNGCTATIDVVITEPPLLVTQIIVVNSTCHGFDDGSFTVNTSGGTPPYTITWTGTVDSGGTFPAGSSYTVTDLGPQTISGHMTDALGCVSSFSGTIAEPNPITSFFTVNHVSTTGGSDGSIDLLIMGGVQPYSYSWSTGDTTEDIDGLSAGYYFVTVTDANGCIHVVDSIEIWEPSIYCETATEIPHVLTVHTGFFASEIGWALLNNTTGDTLSNANCSDLNNANITVNDTVCFEPDEQYCFYAYDDWGDGWNGGSYLISNLESGDTVSSGMPDNGMVGDETAGCTGSDLESDTCFYLVGPPVFGCTDPNATNYNPNATINNGSCTYNVVSGCVDPSAQNYNPNATIEDGSCIYPVTNNTCASAISVSCGSTISGSTIGATATDAPGKCNVLLSDPGVWYEFTGNGDNITVSICNASFDVRLGVFEGSCQSLTCVAGDDNSCGGTGAEATFASNIGSKYYIYVSGIGTGTFDLDITCSALVACPAPENLVELNMTSTKVTLSWDPVPGAIGYAIKGNAYVATTPDVEIYPYYNGTSLTVTSGLVAGIQYYWQVAAICDISGDTSAYSPRSNFTLPTCSAPTPVLTTDVTATTAKLNWTPQPNAIRYVISGRIVPSSNIVTLNINNPATSSLTATQLLPSSTYQWTIQSICVGAASPIAPVQSFTTLAQTSKLATENGIEDKPTLGVHVFPNPNNGKFQLDLTNMLDEQAEIVIYDVVGKEVFRSRVSPNSADMSTSNIELNEAGTYMIKVVSENGTTTSERVIVQ